MNEAAVAALKLVVRSGVLMASSRGDRCTEGPKPQSDARGSARPAPDGRVSAVPMPSHRHRGLENREDNAEVVMRDISATRNALKLLAAPNHFPLLATFMP